MILSKKISMEAKRIKVVKDWSEPKSVCNISVFLGFANFYQRFIQGFSKIAALFTSILKTTQSLGKPISNRNNGSRSAFNRNNNNKLASWKKDGNSEMDRLNIDGNGVEHTKKSGKLSKSEKSKSEKTSKSQNLAKLRKELSKSGNLTNFNTTKAGPKYLTSNAKTASNHL